VTRLRTTDLRAIVTFLGDAQSVEGPMPFSTELLDQLAGLVGCEFSSYFTLDKTRSSLALEGASCSWEPPFVAEEIDCSEEPRVLYARHKQRFGFFRAAKVSDVLSTRLRMQEDSHWNYVEPWRCVDEMWVYLRESWISVAAVTFCARRTFGERERTIAETLRPHFAARFRASRIRRRLDAALAAIGEERVDGIVVLDGGTVEFVSPSARRLMRDYFGSTRRVPDALLNPTPPRLCRNGSELVVTPTNGGSTLLLAERPAVLSSLTARELDVMRCVAAGLRSAEIASKLHIVPSTVRKHLEHVYDKLGVRTRTAALAMLNLSA